jgi:hypothetical protein
MNPFYGVHVPDPNYCYYYYYSAGLVAGREETHPPLKEVCISGSMAWWAQFDQTRQRGPGESAWGLAAERAPSFLHIGHVLASRSRWLRHWRIGGSDSGERDFLECATRFGRCAAVSVSSRDLAAERQSLRTCRLSRPNRASGPGWMLTPDVIKAMHYCIEDRLSQYKSSLLG